MAAGSRGLGGNFLRLWTAAAVSNLGDGLRLAAFPLLAATITRDPGLVAGLTVALRLPWFLFSVPAGGLADRFDRRRLMAFASAGQGVVMAALGLVIVVGGGQLAVLYLAAFLLGVGEVTFDTTSQTLVPAVVDRDDLERAMDVSSLPSESSTSLPGLRLAVSSLLWRWLHHSSWMRRHLPSDRL